MTITNDNLTGVSETTKQQARHAADAAVENVASALSDVLRDYFPHVRTGDERPTIAARLDEAVREYVGAWVMDNVPAPLTLAEAIDTLRGAHDALASLPSDGRPCVIDSEALADLNRAYAEVRTALIRTGTYNNPPRP